MTTIPQAGDVVWVDLNPIRGSEQGGVRPALVISSGRTHLYSARSIVCPITSNLAPWPTKVILPDGMKSKGAVLADQIRAVHRAERGFRFIERAPEEVLADVRAILREILGIDG